MGRAFALKPRFGLVPSRAKSWVVSPQPTTLGYHSAPAAGVIQNGTLQPGNEADAGAELVSSRELEQGGGYLVHGMLLHAAACIAPRERGEFQVHQFVHHGELHIFQHGFER